MSGKLNFHWLSIFGTQRHLPQAFQLWIWICVLRIIYFPNTQCCVGITLLSCGDRNKGLFLSYALLLLTFFSFLFLHLCMCLRSHKSSFLTPLHLISPSIFPPFYPFTTSHSCPASPPPSSLSIILVDSCAFCFSLIFHLFSTSSSHFPPTIFLTNNIPLFSLISQSFLCYSPR